MRIAAFDWDLGLSDREQGETMNRRIAQRVGMPIVTTLAAVGVTPIAHAVPAGPLNVDTSTLSQVTTSECATVPITFYLQSAPADVEDWVVDGDIVDSAGASRGSVFEYETLPVTQATDTHTICGLPLGTSTFTLAVDLRAYGSGFESFYEGRYLKTFYLTRNAVPAPPPEPIKAKSELKLGRPHIQQKTTHSKLVVPIKVKGCTESRALVLRGLTGPSAARWTKIKSVRVIKSVLLRAKVPNKFVRVRGYLAESDACKNAISASIRMPTRRG